MSYSLLSCSLHVVLALLLIKLTFLFGSGILVLLVLRHQVVHVGLSLGELHLVHAFSGVPMQESLTAEHRREVFSNTLEHLLNGRGIPRESNSHLQTLWWDVAYTGFDVIWDPLNKVGAVLVLHVQHLLIDLFGGHAATEKSRG